MINSMVSDKIMNIVTIFYDAGMKSRILIAAFSLLTVSLQAQNVVKINRVELPVEIDGNPFETAWEQIDPLPVTMYTPVFSGEITEKTEIRVAYDNNYIYASGRFYDSQPSKILGNSMIRDVDKGGDFFNFLIDSYNDNQTVLGFSLTPSGSKIDTEINNDAEGDFALFYNVNWNSFWEGKVTRNEKGWFAEMRIPFTSLKFEDKDGQVQFGIIVHRLIGRKNERHVFPAIRPDWVSGAWKASQAQTILMEGIRKKSPLYVTPYLLGGYQMDYDAYPDVTTQNKKFRKEAGIDVKWGISNNVNLDASINTDFAQIEADDQQVNLSRFSLFFPEKRQFFQERSGTFNFATVGNDRLFYSRVIGIHPSGKPVRMYGGIRLTARAKGWDVGLMDAQIMADDSIPSQNFGVLRIRKSAINKNSFIGGIFSSRIDDDGSTQLTYGLDATVNLVESNFLTLKVGQSADLASSFEFGNRAFGYLLSENRNSNGLGYQLELAYYGKDFNPSSGFIARRGVVFSKLMLQYGFFFTSSKIRNITPFIVHNNYHSSSNYNLETTSSSAGVRFTAKTGARSEIFINRNYDSFSEPFNLSEEVVITAGDYTFYSVTGNYTMFDGNRLRFALNLEGGKFYGGNRYSIMLSPIWTVNKYFDLGFDAIYNRVEFDGRDFEGNIARIRITLALNTHLSFNGFLQWNQTQDLSGINLKLRYNWNDGKDLFVVYNENTHNNDPEVPRVENRALLLKYIYTFSKK